MIKLQTGKGPKSIIVGNVGKSGKTMLGIVGGGPNVIWLQKFGSGPKVIMVGSSNGPKLMTLQKFGNGPKTITVGIGGSTTITDGTFNGPSGPISRQGNTMGGGCMFTVGIVGFGSSRVGMSGMFGISISNGAFAT